MAYRLLDHTADLGIEISAASLEELFSEALRALTDCITPVEGIKPRVRRPAAVQAASLDELLLEWLGEAVACFEIEELLFGSARVEVGKAEDGYRLKGEVEGEHYDPQRHPLKVLIKAVTYHGLCVEPRGHDWRARVIFDI
jgi:SHS2 domain-containing protein